MTVTANASAYDLKVTNSGSSPDPRDDTLAGEKTCSGFEELAELEEPPERGERGDPEADIEEWREGAERERGRVSESCAVDLLANAGQTLYEARGRERLVSAHTEAWPRPVMGPVSTNGDDRVQGRMRSTTFLVDRASASPAY